MLGDGSCLPQDTDIQLHFMYCDREVTLSCPVTQPTLAPTIIVPVQDPTDSQQTFYPFPIGRPWGYPPNSYGRPGVRPVPPTVPTTTPLQDPNQQMFNQMYPMSMFDPYYFNSRGSPVALRPQQSRYPKFPPYMYPFKRPVEATTTPSTTSAVWFEQFAGYPPLYPKLYGPQPFVPPGVQYPFMPRYPQDPVFPPRSHKPVSSPAWSSSNNWSRK